VIALGRGAIILMLLLLAGMAAGTAVADDASSPGTFIVHFENDVLGTDDSDKHYSNGIQFTWQTGENQVWGWLDGWARRHFFPAPDVRLHASISVGQNLYTPEDLSTTELIEDDRPYAAWLHADLGMVGIQDDRMRVLEMSVGVVGPAALGEQMQRWIHRVIESPDPQGWDNQISNELALMLVYEQKWRRVYREGSNLEFGLSPHGSAALGNVFTYGGVGGTVRLGQGLGRDFGPPRIQPAPPGSGWFVPSGNFNWYLFAGVDGRLMLQNIFLDGNTFKDSHSVEKIPLVGDVQFGVAAAALGVRVGVVYIMRTREFEGQVSPDHFGSITASFSW
jgi:hypothetical protein